MEFASGHNKWAEPWGSFEKPNPRGFEAIAKSEENVFGGNALVVSHSWTIQTLVCLIEGSKSQSPAFQTVVLPL